MRASTQELISEIWASGESMVATPGRLNHVENLIISRANELDVEAERQGVPPATVRYVGNPFRVQVCGDLSALLADDYCRGVLEFVATHGERCGVVALVHAPSLDAVTEAFAPASATLTAALAVGKTFRFVEPTGAPGVTLPPTATRAADALIGAARLVVGAEPDDVQAALDHALAGDSPSARVALAAALIAGAALVEGAPGRAFLAEGAPVSE